MKKEFKVGDRVRFIGVCSDRDLYGLLGYVVDLCGVSVGVCFDKDINGHDCLRKCIKGHGWYVNSEHLEKLTESIVIYRNGREVIAHNKVTGEKATAKCHVDDEFDFMVGAKIAFDRLTNPIKIVKQDSYKVGDKVKIIDKWVDGCVQNSEGKMDKWLGKTMTIRKIEYDDEYRMEEDMGECGRDGWWWNSKCIEGKVVDTTEPKSKPKKLYNGKVVCVDNKYNTDSLTVGKVYEFVDGYLTDDQGHKRPAVYGAVKDFDDISNVQWDAKFIELVE